MTGFNCISDDKMQLFLVTLYLLLFITCVFIIYTRRALVMDLSLAKLSMVAEEEMDMGEAEVVDIMVEVTMDTEEVPMAGVEVTHPWAEGPEAAVAAITLPSGPITIAVWV